VGKESCRSDRTTKPKSLVKPKRSEQIVDPTDDQLDEAWEEASKLVKLHEPGRGGVPGKRPYHETLDGVRKATGDGIQAIVGLRVQGFRDSDIAKKLGKGPQYVSNLETRYPKAFAQAEAHHLAQVERKYQVNLWGVRAALSKLAPRMIRVLGELAENPETKDNIRRQAAIDVLNLLGAGYSRQTIGGRDSKLQSGAQTFIQNNIAAGAEVATETVTVDAESVEVMDE
jgi:hypothetical protein